MDKQALKNYQDIREEIRDLEKRIKRGKEKKQRLLESGELVSDAVKGTRADGTYGSIVITGFPQVQYDKILEALDKDTELLCRAQEELTQKANDVEAFIQEIEDSRMRRILRYYYLDGMNWVQICMKMDSRKTPDSFRIAHERYLEKNL